MPSNGLVRTLSPDSRIHIVLIPGFAGFDALGQLEYFAGTTELFCRWKKHHPDRATPVLHYFDNFPTAAVTTRASRLLSYLAKRVKRGEIADHDFIALVGHSTGGLDIRQLVWNMARSKESLWIDGGQRTAAEVTGAELLNRIARIVFLSVPQFGTNIANWVEDHPIGRRLAIADLKVGVSSLQVPVVDTLQRIATGAMADMAKTDLIYALQDAFREAESDASHEPLQIAEAQEAASLLSLWLRHMSSDFHAIQDLSVPGNGREANSQNDSPAHFSHEQREEERKIWKKKGIEVRSYATLGRRLFRLGNEPLETWDPLKPWTYERFDNSATEKTDLAYRVCYRACAGGPFRMPQQISDSTDERKIGNRKRIAAWDNDGIVNTGSMLWPNGEQTVLVSADHMDIVGHFRRVRAADGGDREFQAYDLLKSNSGFRRSDFAAVWNDIFNFCVPKKSAVSGNAKAA